MTEKPFLCFQVDGNNDPEDVMIVFARSSIEAKRQWANEHGDGDRYIAGISAKRCPAWDQYAGTGIPALAMIDEGWRFECEGCGTQISDEFIGTRDRSHFDVDEWAMAREYGPDVTTPVMAPVEPRRGRVWCHQSCYEHDCAERRKRRRWEERVHAWLVRRLLKRLPDAEPLPLPPCRPGQCSVYGSRSEHSYVYVSPGKRVYARLTGDLRSWHMRNSHVVAGHQVSEASLHFRWPGAQYGTATLRIFDERHNNKPRKAEFYVAGGDRDAFNAWTDSHKRTAEPAA